MTQVVTKRLPAAAQSPANYRPLYVIWELTNLCDQCCRFCGTRAGKARPDELSTAEVLDVVRQLSELGTREMVLHGGEVYLRSDWLEIVREVRRFGIDCSLVTGGRNLNKSLAKEAKQAGLTAASVSVDGTEEVHDFLRGFKGSFSRALGALENLCEAGIPIACNTQINRRNKDQLMAILDALQGFPLYGWQVQFMVPMGRAADHPDLLLQPYDLIEIMPRLVEAKRLCQSRKILFWPGDNIGYFGPFEHTLRSDCAVGGHSGGCGGGCYSLGLEAHGDVKGCSALSSDGYIAGNVRNTPLRDLWDHARELRFARDFQLDDLWGYCRTCYYADICKGGCLWTSSTLLGRHGNNPYCHHRALEYQKQGKQERLVLVQEAPGNRRDRARFEILLETIPA